MHDREYEAFKYVGLVREADAAREAYTDIFNGTYEFSLLPVDDQYFVMLNVRPTRLEENIIEAPLPGSNASLILRTQPRTNVSEMPIASIARRMEELQLESEGRKEEWNGTVVNMPSTTIARDDYDICIALRKPEGSASSIVLQKSGFFRFGMENPPLAQARRAMRRLVYGNHQLGIEKDNWLKVILLANNVLAIAKKTS